MAAASSYLDSRIYLLENDSLTTAFFPIQSSVGMETCQSRVSFKRSARFRDLPAHGVHRRGKKGKRKPAIIYKSRPFRNQVAIATLGSRNGDSPLRRDKPGGSLAVSPDRSFVVSFRRQSICLCFDHSCTMMRGLANRPRNGELVSWMKTGPRVDLFRPTTLSFWMVLGLAAMIVCLCETDSCLAQALRRRCRVSRSRLRHGAAGRRDARDAERLRRAWRGAGGDPPRQTGGGQGLWLGEYRRTSAGDAGITVLSGQREQGRDRRGRAAAGGRGQAQVGRPHVCAVGPPAAAGRIPLDPRVREITVRQLLLHAGGFDPKQGGDYLQTAKKIAQRPVRSCPFPPIFCCDMPSAARWITRPARKSITATSVSSC